MIPAGVILLWPSTVASIPTGWQRETSLDSKFIKSAANGENSDTIGGSNTHTHTSPTHTHNLQSHSHSGSTNRDGPFETHGGGNTDVARDSHYHDFNFAGVSGGALSDAISYQSGNSEPPYYSPIFIKPSGVGANLAASMVCFWATASVPTGFSFCDGTAGTPDLRDKYLKGAAAGIDAGGTGGSTSHSHDVGHTHTSKSHTHSGGTGYDSDYGSRERSNDLYGAGSANPRHTHTLTLDASAQAGNAYSGTVNATGIEPLYKKLLAIQNTSGGSSQPRGIIGLWLGTIATIPFGWLACDGTRSTPNMGSYHIKCANLTSETGVTAGANTHSHAASNSHTHTATGTHSHTGSTNSYDIYYGTTANADGVAKPHSHASLASCSSDTNIYDATTISGDTANNEPAYRTVTFIQFRFTKGMSQIL